MKKNIFIITLTALTSISSFLFAAKFDATSQQIYEGSSFGGSYTTNCALEDNPENCCNQSDDPNSCKALLGIYNIITDSQVSAFFNFSSLITKLQDLVTNLSAQKTTYCIDLNGKGYAGTPTEMVCSPKGIIDYFSKSFFYPSSANPNEQNIYKALGASSGQGYFTYCPGTFLFLCNLLGENNCTSSSSPFAINGMSFYDYIKKFINSPGSVSEVSGPNGYPAYYDWFLGKNLPSNASNIPDSFTFMQEYINKVVLPYIHLAQQGASIASSLNGSAFAGLTNPIISKQQTVEVCSSPSEKMGGGEIWNSLAPWLQAKITSDFTSGVPFCNCVCASNYLNNGLYYECSPGSNGFGCCGPGWLILMGAGGASAACTVGLAGCSQVLGSLGTAGHTNPNIPQGLYYKLLNCCSCKSSSNEESACTSGANMSPEGAAFLCSLMTDQYNIINGLLEQQTGKFALNDISSEITSAITSTCSSTEQSAIKGCVTNAAQQGAQDCQNSGACKNSQDTSEPCITCITNEINKCYTPQIKDALSACITKATQNSTLLLDMNRMAEGMTAVANAQLQYAALIRKFSLDPDSLPEFTGTCSDPNNPKNCLVEKCLSFCKSSPGIKTFDGEQITIPIKYKELVGWNDYKTVYNKHGQFLAQLTKEIFGTCPKTVSGLSIFFETLQFIGPVVGVAFLAFAIFSGGGIAGSVVMAIFMLLQQAGSITQQIFSAASQSQMATIGLEQEEDIIGVGG
jgi:hypothetical protein